MSATFLLALLIVYMLALFGVAWWTDFSRRGRTRPWLRRATYGLSLGVVCSSWTYFGAVGTVARSGWSYLPNSLGPVLVVTIFFPIWRRVASAAKRENVGSIADFMASRYGRSRFLGILVALVSIVAALPYIALQFTALSLIWVALTGVSTPPWYALPIIVATLALFSILFGARRPALTTHSRGLVRIVAIESILKLMGLGAVAGFALFLVISRFGIGFSPPDIGKLNAYPRLNVSFLTATVLCIATAVTLPRQFHMSFVELEDVNDLRSARWVFAFYMIATALAAPPIAVAGMHFLTGDPDMYVLRLPQLFAGKWFVALVLIGGFSACGSMVMVESIALSAMISNELVLPALSRSNPYLLKGLNVGQTIVFARRMAILAVLGLGLLYFQNLKGQRELAAMGLTALAASAQLFPAMVGAVIWRRAHVSGAIAGIVGGTIIWMAFVAGPEIAQLSWLMTVLPPLHFEVGVLASLALNITLFTGVSILARPRLVDRIQANAFAGPSRPLRPKKQAEINASMADLRALVEQFLGPEDTERAFDAHARVTGKAFRGADLADSNMVRSAERMLAGAVGASSARRVIQWALSDGRTDPEDIGRTLDEAAQAVQFSREILQVTLDSLSQAVSVVDSDLCLIAWNSRYLELFGFPADEVCVGKPLADLVRAGLATHGAVGAKLLNMRLEAMRGRTPQDFEYDWNDGVTLHVVGTPISTGEYVTSFTDVSELRDSARALLKANDELETRVEVRTRELKDANIALEAANALAEKATRSQSRFVAAASHDLMQPLNAARLFIGTVSDRLQNRSVLREFLDKADASIDAANRLLQSLLNLSRLEVDGVKPAFAPVEVEPLLQALAREFRASAEVKGIDLRVARTSLWVLSDAGLLRSVLQNLIGNAVRYTQAGGVIVGCRRDPLGVRFEVRDSGPGIAATDIPKIFEEFHRLPSAAKVAHGAGLGLSIADRVCRALDHKLEVSSMLGKGSNFKVIATRTDPVKSRTQRQTWFPTGPLRVLCVEDDPHILEALEALLDRWGVNSTCATSAEQAEALQGDWDVVLADFDLGAGLNGLKLTESLRGRFRAAALITANPSEALLAAARDNGVAILKKPLAPASLRSFLNHAAPPMSGVAPGAGVTIQT